SLQYATLGNATISQIQLSEVSALFTAFDNFAYTLANAITTRDARDLVLSQILYNVEKYYFTSFPCDLYIDIFDFCNKMTGVRTDITPDIDLQNDIAEKVRDLEDALALAIPDSWAYNGTSEKIGVHVIPLQGVAVPASQHESAYVKGSMDMDKSAFVENSLHWVPNMVPQNDSLLDKLFYWIYQ
ncbi:MAG: hypothetical protein FWF26_01975, partial [Treponema sp.]|nr:hypothetical protein [Treponema sp.]